MRHPTEQDFLACAVEAARAAGAHARENCARRHEVAQRFAHDVKLVLDSECQRKAEEVIRKTFPGHGVLGEEGGALHEEAHPLWIIDPIDGTVNFTHGLPLWCSSVAVRAEGRVVAGAVYLPAVDELYTATVTGPALCNGRPIHPSRVAKLEDALVLTGMSKNIERNPQILDLFKAFSLKAQKTRLMGAAAVDTCHVACGRAEAYFEYTIYLWDFAAAGLIVERAGGRVELLERLDDVRYRLLVTNGLVHDEMKAVVADVLKPR